MLCLRYADADDVLFIVQTQDLPHIKEFVGSSSDGEISASISDPDEAYILALRDENIPVGFVYLRQINRPERSIELFRLAISEPNKGFGSAFMELIIAEAFGPLNANRLWLDVFPQNIPARKIYRRCGFVEEGTLRDIYLWNGAFQSTIIMSILAREYAMR